MSMQPPTVDEVEILLREFYTRFGFDWTYDRLFANLARCDVSDPFPQRAQTWMRATYKRFQQRGNVLDASGRAIATTVRDQAHAITELCSQAMQQGWFPTPGQQKRPCSVAEQSSAAVQIVQNAFALGVWWAWEIVIERVAVELGIALTPERLFYAGGTLRVGEYRFTGNDSAWRSLCHRVCSDASEAARVVDEIGQALTNDRAGDALERWRSAMMKRIALEADDIQQHAHALLNWHDLVYIEMRRPVPASGSFIYGLWRVSGAVVSPFPLNIGETIDLRSRMEGPKGHLRWWGDAGSLGITHLSVEAIRRKDVEERLIRSIVPLSNCKHSLLLQYWRELGL